MTLLFVCIPDEVDDVCVNESSRWECDSKQPLFTCPEYRNNHTHTHMLLVRERKKSSCIKFNVIKYHNKSHYGCLGSKSVVLRPVLEDHQHCKISLSP